MINLINISYEEYIKRFDDRKIICIGAGYILKHFLECHKEKLKLLNNIEYILDNNKELEGNSVHVLNRDVKISYLPDFVIELNRNKWIVFILVADNSVVNVVEQLDILNVFEGIDCIYGMGTLRWGYIYFASAKNRVSEDIYSRTCEDKIPKIIHYCWFGENEIPAKDKECIESFSRYNPDYKILKWSEDNFDLENVPLYVKQAYENQKYAFVSDYVRLAVVYKYGGIYLDTDVEIFSNLDFILKYRMMFAYMEYGEIATGLGFAAQAGSKEISEMLQMYEDIPFVMRDGTLNLTPCPRYANEYFRRKGIWLDNTLEVKDDILFLSSDYLCPMTPVLCADDSYQLAELKLSDNTIGIHWCNNTWKNPQELGIFEAEKRNRAALNQRMFSDWKRMKGFD